MSPVHKRQQSSWKDGWRQNCVCMKCLWHIQRQGGRVIYEGKQFLRWVFSCVGLSWLSFLHIADHLASQAIMCRPHACFFPSWSNSTSMPVITARIQKAWIMGKRDGEHKAEIEGGFKCIDNKDSVFFDLGFCLLWT